MTFSHKILQKILFGILLLFFVFSEAMVSAQISSEQQNQLNQYASLINDYKKQKKYRMVGYYLYKSGSVYLKAGEHQNAIDKYLESAQYYEQIGSYSNKKKIYSNIAFVYAEMGQLKNSKKYYDKGLEISRRLNNRHDISASLMEVATIEIYTQDYSTAQTNLEEALKIANSLNDALLLRTCYRLLAQLYKAYGNKKKHDQYFDNFLIYKKLIEEKGTNKRADDKDKDLIAEKEKSQILIDEKEFQAKEYELLDLRKKLAEDSLSNAISAAEDSLLREQQINDQLKEINKLQERENLLKKQNEEFLAEQIANRDLQLIGAGIGIILLIILIIGAIVAFMQKRKANKQLEQQKIEIEIKSDQVKNKNDELEDAMDQIQYQNKNIMQSINYAQRIQEAMMPKQILMQSHLKDSFIFFKPRDIVSGDFYWFADTKLERNGAKNKKNPVQVSSGSSSSNGSKKFIVSAVDCTGHGVPGAFMSMLGHNLLNDIVGKGILESNKILGQLHLGIRTSLNQEATQNRDGMDMALCVIDPENKTLEYAGAQNPLIYIQDEKIFRVRGNKFPVGGFQVESHDYTKHIIKIDKPTTCYIFTDGFHDQFGGPQGRKFMTKNFRDLLFEIHKMPLEEQKNILELVINEWMGENEQTDDILVIGFKLDFSENNKSTEPGDDDITIKEIQKEKKDPLEKSLSVEEQQIEIKKPVKEILTVEELKPENQKTVEDDIPVKEQQPKYKKPIKNVKALKELLFRDDKKVEKERTVKKVKKENKNVVSVEKPVKKLNKEKENLPDKDILKENKKIVENDLTFNEIDKKKLEHVVKDEMVKDEHIEIKAIDNDLTEKTKEENKKPVNDTFKIKKIKQEKGKPAKEVIDIKELQKENKKEVPIEKTEGKTIISNSKIIKVKKL
ncbi:MAG: tetratricopeptide repeat protein [Bacteroidota bacterium]